MMAKAALDVFSGSDFHEKPMEGTSTCASSWHVDQSHPLFELRLCELAGCDSRRHLEGILLGCGLELLTRGVGKPLIVILEHADKAIKLVESPLMGLCRIRSRKAFCLLNRS